MAIRIPIPTSAIADFCRKNHIRRLSLFGSVLRDDFDTDSDVDVLVEFEPGKTGGFFNFITLQMQLSELLGRPVDLNTPEDLSRYFRQEVLKNAVPLYEQR